ncbi:D-2-hydroxyacid dehydrogenase family protein [Alphaproteobacteria bacterium LSUCC0684]
MKIAILDDWTQDAAKSADWQRLGSEHEVEIFTDTVSGQALIKRLQDADIICAMRERTSFSREVIESLPKLKAIITSGMRNAAIDLAACDAAGIVVSGTDSPGHATAELAMTLIGALARQIVPNANSMQNGAWQITAGRDLKGARLGILGLGRLGTAVAKLGQAYGMNVQAWSQNLTPERAAEEGVIYCEKDNFFASSDFISIHLKLSARVVGLVGAPELALMKPTSFLVNTSRAPIVDQSALITALEEGRIAGAALDVYDTEPLPAEDRLRSVPNLILTPHIGYVTEETMQVFHGQMLESVEAFLAGKPVRLLSSASTAG